MALTPAEINAAQAQINAARDQAATNIDLARGWAEIAEAAADASGSESAQTATAEANRAAQQKALAETACTGAEAARTGAETARTGAETARTQTQNTASTIQATVDNMKDEILGGAGPAFDTLKELADALGNDPNLASTLSGQIATKQDKPPAGTAASMYLNGSGAWSTPPDTTYSVPSQTEAETGTATTGRAFSAQRVRQAADAAIAANGRLAAAPATWKWDGTSLPTSASQVHAQARVGDFIVAPNLTTNPGWHQITGV